MIPDVTPGTLDLILALVALEAVGLAGLLALRGAMRLVAPALLHLAAGGLLLLAVRAALADPGSPVVALALLASLLAHAASLVVSARALATGRAGATAGSKPMSPEPT